MKKLMVVAAVALAASFANAASCAWTASGVTAAAGDADPVGYVAYLLNGDSTAQAAAKAAIAGGDLSVLTSAYVADTTVIKPVPTMPMYTVNKQNIGGADAYTAGQYYDMFMVIFNSTESASAADQFIISDAKHVQTPGSGSLPMSFGNVPTAWNDIQTVPEPTSGLLLLLGVAGLALRRRRA